MARKPGTLLTIALLVLIFAQVRQSTAVSYEEEYDWIYDFGASETRVTVTVTIHPSSSWTGWSFELVPASRFDGFTAYSLRKEESGETRIPLTLAAVHAIPEPRPLLTASWFVQTVLGFQRTLRSAVAIWEPDCSEECQCGRVVPPKQCARSQRTHERRYNVPAFMNRMREMPSLI